MADLTFYFPSTGSAAHSPAISGTWLHSEGATRLPLVTSPSSSARANRKASVWAVGTQTNLAQQYVSAAQDAHEWSTNDTIEMQFSCMREANCSSAYMYLIVRVFNADCSSVRGTLYDGVAPTNLSNSQFTNRAMAAGGGHVHVQNAVSMSANDHIVIEIGFTATASSAWAGATYKVGDNEAADLPVDETTDTWDSYNPWIAFTFYVATTKYNQVMMLL